MPIDARAEYFAHGADIGIRGLGPTREAAFRASVVDVSTLHLKRELHVDCEAPREDCCWSIG